VINFSDKIAILTTVMSPQEYSQNFTVGRGRAIYEWKVIAGNLDLSRKGVLASSRYL
jgi:hypothetical protein